MSFKADLKPHELEISENLPLKLSSYFLQHLILPVKVKKVFYLLQVNNLTSFS